eukprot:scaffold448994_cov19-Prasinocladus_malaysianus.AAC.1
MPLRGSMIRAIAGQMQSLLRAIDVWNGGFKLPLGHRWTNSKRMEHTTAYICKWALCCRPCKADGYSANPNAGVGRHSA